MAYLISVTVLILSALPSAKLCLQPVLWSQYRGVVQSLVAILTLYAVLIFTAWQNFPWVLPYAATVAIILAGFFWWRSRPNFGVKRGFPPGSLSMVRSLASVDDPDFYLECGNRYDQVFKMSQFHRPTLCVTNIAKGLDLIRNNEAKLGPAALPFDRLIPRRFIRYMEKEDHQHYKGILKSIILPEIILANKEVIQTASANHINRMSDASDLHDENWAR